MKREDAVAIVGDAIGRMQNWRLDDVIVTALHELGLIQFDDEKPQSPVDVLAGLVIYSRDVVRTKYSTDLPPSDGWLIGEHGAKRIVEKLKESGYVIRPDVPQPF